MILIADSGSTKTTWSLVDKSEKVQTCNTKGINPFMMDGTEILSLLENDFCLPAEGVQAVYYYGAGVLPGKKETLLRLLQSYFQTDHVEVYSDLVGAARSLCQDKPGIACILGTGSNSCYYDGKKVIKNISPLGYVLGDEGSGAVLGKNLIADILKNQLPEAVKQDFFNTYPVSVEEIIENVYRRPFPNRYLAQYSRFLSKNIHIPEIVALVERNFRSFFERNIMQYEQAKEYPVYFTGSIAFVFADILNKVARDFELQIGHISKEPIDGLVTYHRKNIK